MNIGINMIKPPKSKPANKSSQTKKRQTSGGHLTNPLKMARDNPKAKNPKKKR
jgi:hypothetical protein